MLGAIIGDIVGSRFEWDNIKTKDFEFFSEDCFFTDDSVMSIAVAKALLESGDNYEDLGLHATKTMREIGNEYPGSGYGGHFGYWLKHEELGPYNSYGNGSAMRVSPCGFAAKSLEEAKQFARSVSEITHNHEEGLKGAEATAVAIYLARQGYLKDEIKTYIVNHYYDIDFTLDEIREDYSFDVSCQGSVPQALEAFFESDSFEDAIRNAISIGGDSDTLGAICGGVAEAYYGIPTHLKKKALDYLDDDLIAIVEEFEQHYFKF